MLALETPLLRVSAPSRVEREIFDFSANRIASIDSFLASGATVLRHVFELNLSDNKLQSIPQNLSQVGLPSLFFIRVGLTFLFFAGLTRSARLEFKIESI